MRVKFVLTLSLSFIGFCASAQLLDTSWSRIESDIRARYELVLVDSIVNFRKDHAWQAHDYISFARALYDGLKIRDIRTEDSLYFRNSAFIDSLLLLKTTPHLLKIVLHLMQTERLRVFEGAYHHFQRSRYETPDLPFNYAACDQKTLDSLIDAHFEEAADDDGLLDALQPEPLLWLAADPFSYLFQPHWKDIVFGNQLGNTQHGYRGSFHWPEQSREWMSLSRRELADTLEMDIGAPSVRNIYGRWLRARRDNPEAHGFIETLARKSLYDQFSSDSAVARMYEDYLEARLKDTIACVKAYAVYQLCLAWHESTPETDEDGSTYYGYHPGQRLPGNTNRHSPNQVLDLFKANKDLMTRYGNLYQVLETMKSQILAPYLDCRMNSTAAPDKPILARVTYTNISQLCYRIVRFDVEDAAAFEKQPPRARLDKLPTVQKASFQLPHPADHRDHRVLLKIDPLPTGHYYLIFSDEANLRDHHELGAVPLTVTSLLLLHTDDRLSVVQTSSGQPLSGVKIHVIADETIEKPKHQPNPENFVTGKMGFAPIKREGEKRLQLSYQGDTILDAARISHPAIDEVMDGKSRDDAEDFFRDHTQLIVYTDRGIYRPGQTVHFKGVLVTRDALTGEPTLFTTASTANAWGKHGLDRWIKTVKPKLYVYSPFEEVQDSFAIRPDDYGSFSGSFTLPVASATGKWRFDNDDLDLQRYTSSFHVEEYKRPTFELSILPPTRTYMPGDSIYFTARARSLNGGSMANTTIRYSVTRDYSSILEGAGVTGPDGELRIGLRDTAKKIPHSRASGVITNSYSIHTVAADVSGETHEADGAIDVSDYPVKIRLTAPATFLRGEIPALHIETTDPNRLLLSKTLQVSIYAWTPKKHSFESDYSRFADQWLYSPQDLQASFPDIRIIRPGMDTSSRLVYTTSLKTGMGEKLTVPPRLLSSGKYHVVIRCEENHRLLGTTSTDWTILDTTAREWPADEPSLVYLPFNDVRPGDKIHYYAGAAFDSTNLFVNIRYISHDHKKAQFRSLFLQKSLTPGVHGFDWTVPDDIADQASLTFLFVHHGLVWRHQESVWIRRPEETPVIRIEQFRNATMPGETTQFALSVRAKNVKAAAQVMTTIYDAALDHLQPYQWQIPELGNPRLVGNDWPYRTTYDVEDHIYGSFSFDKSTGKYRPVWWISDSLWSEIRLRSSYPTIIDRNVEENSITALDGRTPGLNITQARGLNDVVVLGYSTTRRLSMGNVVTIRGQNTLPALETGVLVILDGLVFQGDVNSIDLKTISDGRLLEGADAIALYGSRAAHGALVLSTKGPLKLPKGPEQLPLRVRNNFSELAFFSPDLQRDSSGNYTFTFTLPESVTEWTWKALAQLKPARFAYSQRNFSTRLPVMIQPHLPRLLYAGDHISVKARISNLDSIEVAGQAVCVLEDAITGKDITGILCDHPKVEFRASANGNCPVGFVITVPRDALHPIRITIKAVTTQFGDAEVHTIPVLPARILVRQAVPFQLSDTNVMTRQNVGPSGSGVLVGIGVSLAEPPQAALLNSLPWLANYSINCAEQTFNKMLAHATALALMRTDPALRTAYEGLKREMKTVPANNLTPDEPLAGTLPWLGRVTKKATQQTELIRLMDTAQAKEKIESYLERLYTLQNPDGGISWFDGGKSDRYISAYLLVAFGKLNQTPWRFTSSRFDNLQPFLSRLVAYIDAHWTPASNGYWAYCRYLWLDQYPITSILRDSVRHYLSLAGSSIDGQSLYEQSRWIIDVLHYFNNSSPLYQQAVGQLENIYQRGYTDKLYGFRWKEIADDDDLTTTQEETVAMLFEAFAGSAHQADVQTGLLTWLLNTAADHHWKTTKATAAVIGILRKEGKSIAGQGARVTGQIADSSFELSDDPFQGRSFSYLEAKKNPEVVKLERIGTAPATGSIISWQLVPLDSLATSNRSIQLQKRIYAFNDTLRDWSLVSPNMALKIGVHVKTVLTVQTARPLRYVYIDDKRSPGLEPLEVVSGYSYESGLSVYRSIRDAGCEFFCDFIPSGRWELSYESRVEYEGEFASGAASLQCMYKPDMNAYSNAQKLIVH